MENIFWLNESNRAKPIIVVGAGFVGLSTAYHLKVKYPTQPVWVFDKNSFTHGASVRNAGFACFGSISELEANSKDVGDQAVVNLVAERNAGIELARQTLTDTAIGYEQVGGFELPNQDTDWEGLVMKWNNLLEPVFGAPAFSIEKAENFTDVPFLIKHKFEGWLNPSMMASKWRSMCQGLGVQFFWNQAVERMESGVVHTKDEAFEALATFVCTNGYSKDLIGSIIAPKRNEVFVTNNIAGLGAKFRGTYHFDAGYTYFRTVGDRLLIGGGRNKLMGTETDVHENTEEARELMQQFVKRYILPNTDFEFEFEWSGILGFTATNLPVIEERFDNTFVGVGMNGMGVALSASIGQKLAEKIRL